MSNLSRQALSMLKVAITPTSVFCASLFLFGNGSQEVNSHGGCYSKPSNNRTESTPKQRFVKDLMNTGIDGPLGLKPLKTFVRSRG
ncbi:hypothetical protein BJ878DRAFT_495805 [Calycina marina]|uniref:Uncharacterized protein n=1 Tax=Calycina marina TaxID=1763456 RepID=A0A9P7Z860_9HELO|nr:hypothetical protein BJ878DRAFT_495805 [Calycina marina]